MVKAVPISIISDRVDSNPIKVRKIRVKSQEQLKNEESSKKGSIITRTFKEFAANTALHGYNHIVRDGTTKWEK